MKMTATVDWAGKMTFIGKGMKTGHSVTMDGGADTGGLGLGVSPMEMLLMGAGGCAAIDIVMILKKARQNIENVHVTIDGDRSEEIPKVFTKLHLNFTVIGQDLNEAQVARAVELSMSKYCSVSLTLAQGCEMSWAHAIEA